MCDSLELTWNLPHALPSSITLTLGISGISESSPGNGHVFMVHQKPETLNQTNQIHCSESSLVKLLGKRMSYMTHCSFQCHYGE